MLVVRYLVWLVARALLSLRYRVRVHGLEQADGLRGPILILPNHPGMADPPNVLAALWGRLRPRPVLFEGIFQSPVMRPLMSLVNALRIPALDLASAEARARAQKAVDEAANALRQGTNLILWSAGHIQRGSGVERIGSTRAVSDLLKAVPETNVLLVRTRGIWGSSLGFAYTGAHPQLGRVALRGIGLVLANLLFFMPRRRVNITLEYVSRAQLPGTDREVLNPWLERWYNADGPEKPTYVPYHFLFGPRTYEFPRVNTLAEADLTKVKAETRERVAQILAEKLQRPLRDDEQKPETTLDQLGLDSLDRMEITLRVEQQFGFSGDQVPGTLGQLWALAQGLAEREPVKPAPPHWLRPASSTGLLEVLGETMPEAFVARASASPRDVAVADDLSGVLTYERLLMGALLMSRRLGQIPANNVGLMLPASVASDVVLMGIFLAGKLPVVLNWTTGPANLAHAARLMGLSHVITSRQFLDRTGIAVSGVEYVCLEDLRKEIGRMARLRAFLHVRLFPGRIRRHVAKLSPDQPAVVLFTSGSERAPKAVPLTHRNIISDIRAAVPVAGLRREDSMLGFLPAFHSFGMTGTLLGPLLGGMRIIHHPDPTDAGRLVRKIATYRPTMLVGTPTFVGFILERAEPGQLDSLRLIVVGAEKCPPHVRERCAKLAPVAKLIEGYGITECSPVVAVNPPDNNRPGSLGQLLPGVEARITDVDTGQPLSNGERGLLEVSGPTVFPGYLGQEGPSPFREEAGRRWYVTGDLVRLDADRFLWFEGRLKRFLKAGGEMISLPALEEPFVRQYPPTEDGPRVAVEGIETEQGRCIVLFATEPLTLRDANARLLGEGFHGVMRLDEVRQIDKIPVLGTGKIDYKVLRARIADDKPTTIAASLPEL
jgi:acyl-CoA synthetase (AMP-forming)/AMP-acid ligase II/acyl carrier protein